MRIKMEQQSIYEGSIDHMPTWGKNLVMPRWRRFLINQYTMYATVVIGSMFATHGYPWLNLGTWFLVMELSGIAYRSHWLQACINIEKKQREEEKKDLTKPIVSPFVQKL